MLLSHLNVWNTCLLLLQSRGYRLFLLGDPDEHGSISNCTWNAEKDGMKLRGANPIELLGLSAVLEYHAPVSDAPYWWRLEGRNLVDELKSEWLQHNTTDGGSGPHNA